MNVLQDKDDIVSHKNWMELEITMLSKTSRAHDDKYCIISPLFGRQKRKLSMATSKLGGRNYKGREKEWENESGKDRKTSGVSLEKE